MRSLRPTCTRVAVLSVTLAALVPAQTSAEPPSEAIAQAFKASEKAERRRVQLNYRFADREFSQVTSRVLPDRTHIVVTRPGKPPQEYFAIGREFFSKSGAKWQSEPFPLRISTDASAVDAFMPHMAGLQEGPRQTVNGRQQRVFAGTIGWQSGQLRNTGSLQLLIDAQSKLPTRATFDGQCGAAKCSFTQTFSYDRNITIDRPK
jgi:hypothetical protein